MECLDPGALGLLLMFFGALSAVAVWATWRYVRATVLLWRATRKL